MFNSDPIRQWYDQALMEERRQAIVFFPLVNSGASKSLNRNISVGHLSEFDQAIFLNSSRNLRDRVDFGRTFVFS
jgi:hypothetical protein